MSSDTLVTGVSGFVAGNLARSLVEGGAGVLGVGRTPPRETYPRLAFEPLDLLDFDALLRLLAREKPRTVYHLAANSVLQGAAEGPLAMLEINVRGTWNLLEAARRAEVPVVVVASSDKQYGALARPPYDDGDSTAFLNGGVYELSKAQQDQVARLYAGLYDTPGVRVARLANIYGPGDTHWTRLVPGTIRRTLLGEPPRVVAGAGAALREYVFVDDAVAALQALAADARTRGNAPLRRQDGKLASAAFNVGSEARFAAAQVIEKVQKVMAEEFGIAGPPPEIVPANPAVFEPGSQFSDLSKLRSLLPGYAPRDLETGLRATIPWYLTHLARGA